MLFSSLVGNVHTCVYIYNNTQEFLKRLQWSRATFTTLLPSHVCGEEAHEQAQEAEGAKHQGACLANKMDIAQALNAQKRMSSKHGILPAILQLPHAHRDPRVTAKAFAIGRSTAYYRKNENKKRLHSYSCSADSAC